MLPSVQSEPLMAYLISTCELILTSHPHTHTHTHTNPNPHAHIYTHTHMHTAFDTPANQFSKTHTQPQSSRTHTHMHMHTSTWHFLSLNSQPLLTSTHLSLTHHCIVTPLSQPHAGLHTDNCSVFPGPRNGGGDYSYACFISFIKTQTAIQYTRNLNTVKVKF